MDPAIIWLASTEIKMKKGPDICDITAKLNHLIDNSEITNGALFATIVGSTGSLTTIEFERGVVEDLKRAINTLSPPHLDYEHEKAWHDGNGHSHVQAALLGPSISLPVRNGQLKLGTWQQIVAINHDNRPRMRSIEVTIAGTKKS